MFKTRLVVISTISIIIIVCGVIAWRTKVKTAFDHKMIVAKEMHKVVGNLMFDLRHAEHGSIRDIPTDGQWHDRIAFKHDGALVEYHINDYHLSRVSFGKELLVADHIASLRMRRMRQAEGILEVQVRAQGLSLPANFNIKLQD